MPRIFTRGVSTGQPGTYVSRLAGTSMVAAPLPMFNVQDFGAQGDGVADDTAALSAAITASNAAGAGEIVLPRSTYLLSAPLPALAANTRFRGNGNGTILRLAAGYSGGGPVIPVGGDSVSIESMFFRGGPSSTAASNPAATFIGLTGTQNVTVKDIGSQYVNGWIVEALGGPSRGFQGLIIENVRGRNNGYGIHLKGDPGSSYAAQALITNVNMQQISLGDVIWVEDCNDVQITQVNAAVAGSATSNASDLRITGASSSVFAMSIDVGSYPTMPGATPAILIEPNGNGTPDNVHLVGGIVQQSLEGIRVAGGTHIYIVNFKVSRSGSHGISILAGSSIQVKSCVFSLNGQTAGTNYEINLQSTSSPIWVESCDFGTPKGTAGGGQVAAVAAHGSSSNGAEWSGNSFGGSGFTGSAIFSTTPKYAYRNRGYNPFGSQSVAVPASGSPSSGASFERYFTITANAGASCSVVVGTAPAVTIPAGAAVTLFCPPGQTVTPTYTAAPTWSVFGN